MKTAWLVLVFSFLLFVNLPANAGTYYVAMGGNDSNPGTEALPWASIQHAADSLLPGDTVYVKAGTYSEFVVAANSGSSGVPITYAASPGDVVTIDGEGITVPLYCGLFYVTGSYITIDGFHVINSNQAGILADGATGIVIQHNHTYNTYSSGIGIWNSSYVTVDGNEVQLACNDGGQECISLGSTDHFEVMNNVVHDGGPGTNGGEGIDPKDGSAFGSVHNNVVYHMNRLGFYCDAWDKWTHDIEFYSNISYANHGYGYAVACENGGTLENIHIYNNVAYENYLDGFAFGGWGNPTTHALRSIDVTNNTFYNNGTAYWGGCISIENPDIQNIVVRNNACSQNAFYQIRKDTNITTGYTVEYNLIDGYRGYEDEIYGDNYVEGAAEFADPEGANFHLKAVSAAIDAGTATGAPATDFDGSPRPVGSGFDIGAFELQETGSNFTITCSPSSLLVRLGVDGDATCSICSMNGFNSPVAMSCNGLPAGIYCSFNPDSVTPPANGCITTHLNLQAYAAPPLGESVVQAVGTSSALVNSYDLNLTVGPECLFCDEFECCDEWWWSVVKGCCWEETGGQMIGQAVRKTVALAPYQFPGCSDCTVETQMSTDGGYHNRVWLLGWYSDRYNYIELMMKEENDRWILKQRVGGKVVMKAKANRAIDPGVFYNSVISFDGSTFTVSIDGDPIITMPRYSGSLPDGTVGFQVKATTGRFENIMVFE